VLVLATLDAPQRRRLLSRKQHNAQPEPEPTAVSTSRATIIDVGDPLAGPEQAAAWLRSAGEGDVAAGLAVLNRALHAHRIAAADPHVHGVGREDALVARLGYGAGEEVADGRWSDARELFEREPRRHRRRVSLAQARFAALLTGRQVALACEELALRARLDLDEVREREAALQVLAALDAAIVELATGAAASALADRVRELQGLHPGVAAAARSALEGSLGAAEREAIAFALGRIEAALRARSVALPE
jgi:hypothetical protein